MLLREAAQLGKPLADIAVRLDDMRLHERTDSIVVLLVVGGLELRQHQLDLAPARLDLLDVIADHRLTKHGRGERSKRVVNAFGALDSLALHLAVRGKTAENMQRTVENPLGVIVEFDHGSTRDNGVVVDIAERPSTAHCDCDADTRADKQCARAEHDQQNDFVENANLRQNIHRCSLIRQAEIKKAKTVIIQK